ncbi:MAG: T9SS type A sorting domain-containing protein [Bacteroidetes bacterium]|nr:T9SS type A sorting domain-containing protein [Bacteroidota bacterium]
MNRNSGPGKFLPFLLLFCLPSEHSFGQEATLKATFDLLKVNSQTVPVQNGIVYPSFEKQNRPVIDLAGTWKKQRVNANDALTLVARTPQSIASIETEAAGRFQPDFDDSGWENKTLPAVENTMKAYETVPEFYEDGVWYRRSFFVADSLSSKTAILKFISANYVADVWVNGNYVGYHEGGYTPFAFDVSSHLNFNAENKIAVRVDNIAWGTRNDIVPYSKVDWFNYTGLIHDIRLEFNPPVYISRVDLVPVTSTGNFSAKLIVQNSDLVSKTVSVSYSVFNAVVTADNKNSEFAGDLTGSEVSLQGESDFQFSVSSSDSISVDSRLLSIPTPKLWTPKFPNLYILKATLSENGKVVDEFYTQFGIRTIETSGNKVLLNGIKTFFPSVARHEDHPDYGRSIPNPVITTDLEKVKSINATMLRTAHYPNHLFTYLASDRLGIAITEEIPVWQFDRPENFIIQNERRHIHQQMWREMIFRDYNRPSILFWSGQNESLELANRKIFLQTIHTDLDTNYPDGRLVTQSAAADRPGPEDSSQDVVDVAGWTIYFGVFYGTKAEPETRAFLSAAQKAHPNKPIMDTEFGIWDTEAHNMQAKQNEIFDNTFKAFEAYAARSKSGSVSDTTALMAATWWCIFDWYRHGNGINSTGWQTMGLFQMNRTSAKTVASTIKVRYFPFALTQPWNTDVDGDENLLNFNLKPAYPNPFNPETTIEYTLGSPSHVVLQVFDITGREVSTLVNQRQSGGLHSAHFNASSGGQTLGSGLYFYRISTPEFTKTGKMMLVK